jgi:uncharacterized 2Fe-2S/4Fe-4S cluster protein (DUF4445 family)
MSKTESKPNQAEYQKRLDRLTGIFSDIVIQADQQSLERCPYKNMRDECTAMFGCRNQRKKLSKGAKVLLCVGDGKLDYRTAWETDPEAVNDVKKQLQAGSQATDSHQDSHVPGKTLFDYADQLDRQVPTSCGRSGLCHECIVEVHRGAEALSPRTEAESFLQGDYRLACQAVIEESRADIDFSLLRRVPKILDRGRHRKVRLDAMVTRQGDAVLYDGKRIDRYRGHLYGLAIDLGTTTVVIDLVDLESGDTIQLSAFENPQRFGGSDVMNRISYDGQNKDELWKAVVNTINHEIEYMAEQLGFSRKEIYEIVLVGNSTMRDICFRLDVQGIGQKPYKSLTEHEMLQGKRDTTTLNSSSRRLGLKVNPGARVYSPPLVASHVGADISSGLGAIDFAANDETVMLVDVGTNTEVVIRHQGRMLTASCPAGPAFEGGLIKYGMPGYDGAIDSIQISGDGFDYTTIGNAEPKGLCGSGLIDLLAELRRHEQMTEKGVFADKRQFELMLVPERGITFSRQDASNLAQAKAANYCGQFIVMRHLGLNPADIDRLYLAGGFANFIDIGNAIDIGFLPGVPEARIEKIGNAAAQGAREILLSREKRRAAEEIVRNIEHIELETTPDFFEIFVEGCQFKPMPELIVERMT